MKYAALLLTLSAQCFAFPFALDSVNEKRQVPTAVTSAARQFSKSRGNCGAIPCPIFDADEQHVSTTGKHAYQSPRPGDIRGPCPGLNAAANHGYLSRNGVTTLTETITGLGSAFAMGPNLAGFLAAYAIIMTGDPVLQSWSIGGPPPTDSLTRGFLGQPQGISFSHNTYEGDMSIGRPDAYMNHGDAHSLDISRFAQAYKTGMKHNRYTLDGLAQDYAAKGRQSVKENPYFFAGPFSGVLVAPAAYFFVINAMSNHSAEEPNGYLDGETFKQFFGVRGEYPHFKWLPGQERIPNQWYRRPTLFPYDIANANADVSAQYSAYPESFKLGGNVNGVNSYVGVDMQDLTGGVMNADYLFNNESPRAACFYAQLASSMVPDSSSLLVHELSAVTDLIRDAVEPVMAGLDCPKVDKFDQTLFNKYPGRKYNPKGRAATF